VASGTVRAVVVWPAWGAKRPPAPGVGYPGGEHQPGPPGAVPELCRDSYVPGWLLERRRRLRLPPSVSTFAVAFVPVLRGARLGRPRGLRCSFRLHLRGRFRPRPPRCPPWPPPRPSLFLPFPPRCRPRFWLLIVARWAREACGGRRWESSRPGKAAWIRCGGPGEWLLLNLAWWSWRLGWSERCGRSGGRRVRGRGWSPLPAGTGEVAVQL